MSHGTPRRIAAALLCSAVLALSAHAVPRNKREFVTTYPKTKGTRLDACVTCHAATIPELNPYGSSLKKAKMNLVAVEREDSDGDGISNRKEIDALAFPGDRRDRPGARRDSVSADSAKVDSSGAKPDTAGVLPDSLKKKG